MYGIPDRLKALSAAEEQVLLALWDCKPPVSRRDIGARLAEKGWAAATVLNFLYRLEEKGWVTCTKEQNHNLYAPTVTRRAYGVYTMRQRLDTVFGGDLAEAVRLAKRVRTADRELGDLTRQMTALLNESPAAGLLDQPGIGPVTAAIAYAAWSHPGRIRSEAAFASLAGVNPIPASSGNTVRHRINRGGDRRLNRALHMAVVTRMRMDPETRAYVDKRTAQGRTPREIRRSLKRYLARQIYRQLNATITPAAAA